MTDKVESFSAMLRMALGSRVAADTDSFTNMLAENGIMEFPYAPPGQTRRLEGRAAVARYLEELGDRITFDHMGMPTIHATINPDVTILEFTGHGSSIDTGEPYDQTYISVIRTEGGRILHYRDYWNPLALLRTLHPAGFAKALSNEKSTNG